ncbi:MAG: T9SS type A sorting domain-containing protein [Lewinellaceae bacterium]|nr:T9SS type A sorting domain-containing protein [Lewinellaceae bacterium]
MLIGAYIRNGFRILALTKKGTPDLAFGQEGMVSRELNQDADGNVQLLEQPDGSFYVIRSGWDYRVRSSVRPGDAMILVEKMGPDGTWDESWGYGGMEASHFSEADFLFGVAPSATGGFYVAGTAKKGKDYNFLVARFNDDGRPDSTFAGAGFVAVPYPKCMNYGFKVQESPDGSVYLAGASISMFATYAIVRVVDQLEISLPNDQTAFEPSIADKRQQETNTMLIYPNPISGSEARVKVNLEIAEDIEISIFDTSGKLIKLVDAGPQHAGLNEIKLDLADIHDNGIYIVRIASRSHSGMVQIVVADR